MNRIDDIRTAITTASEHLREHPEEARSRDSLATASLVDGLIMRVTGPNGEELSTDMVPSVGGTGSAPSPGWLLRAAEASCVATLIAMRAAMLGVTLTHLEVSADSESDDRGLLGVDGDVPAGPLSGRIVVRIAAEGIDDAALRELAGWGIVHCPVCDAVERAVPMAHEIVTT